MTTVPPRSTALRYAARTRVARSSCDSPPGRACVGSSRNRRSSSGRSAMRSRIATPSQSPKPCSSQSQSSTGSTPSASATARPVSLARASAEVKTTVSPVSTSSATPRPAAAAWARPSAVRDGSAPPRPSRRPSTVKGVTPWRTRMIRVGPPRSGGATRRSPDRSRAWASQTTVLPSIASLESASASVFSSRGTQVNRTCPPAASMPRTTSRAWRASRRMSSCLIFHRPLICSTTSLESSRASIEAPGARAAAASSPTISPVYSATLLLAIPRGAARRARTAPVCGSRTRAPYPATPGLPRDPPSASTTRRRYAAPLTVRTRRCARGCGGTPRSAAPHRARRSRTG